MNFAKFGSVGKLLSDGIKILVAVVGVVAVLFLIWAGVKYVMAGGDAKKAGEAKEGITHALIGLAIVILSYLLVSVVLNLLGNGISIENGINALG
jgi:TRAP-type C4-dicarboxylate transport system permease small subunit